MELWFVGLLLVVAMIKVVTEVLRRRDRRAADLRGPFLLDWPDPTKPVTPMLQERPVSAQPALQQPIGARPAVQRPISPSPAVQRPASASPPLPLPIPTPPPHPSPSLAEVDEGSETIRIDASDGRIQFLPGRLEVVRGVEAGKEFHFLRLPGQAVPEVTMGRSHGAMYRHIQIAEPTVSRLHARLSYEDRLWRIANLSETNPIRVNGQDLSSPNEAVTLADGDRIELGDVELCYRDRRP